MAPYDLRGCDAIVLDPPRAGALDQIRQIALSKATTVVYVSCNPATQMRDLRAFIAAGYELEAVQPFDLFPQTRHLECIVTLRKSPAVPKISLALE